MPCIIQQLDSITTFVVCRNHTYSNELTVDQHITKQITLQKKACPVSLAKTIASVVTVNSTQFNFIWKKITIITKQLYKHTSESVVKAARLE